MPSLLLVDANPMTQRLVELTFAREPVRVIAASDGLRAIDVIRAERPDLVMADHQASGVSGYELSARLKDEPELSRIPVLLLAGAFDVVSAERVSTCGCAGVLVKPFDPAELVARVTALIQDAAKPVPPPVTPAQHVAPAPRRGEPAGTVEELFDRLDRLLGARPRPPAAQRERNSDDEAVEAGALPTVERLLGSTAAADDRSAPEPPSARNDTSVASSAPLGRGGPAEEEP
jgi:DNA-binding response OmpR family regulator